MTDFATCPDADAQRLDEIDTYLRSPAARWTPCGTLDALDDERAELQRRAAETADRLPSGMTRVSGSPGGDGIFRITY